MLQPGGDLGGDVSGEQESEPSESDDLHVGALSGPVPLLVPIQVQPGSLSRGGNGPQPVEGGVVIVERERGRAGPGELWG